MLLELLSMNWGGFLINIVIPLFFFGVPLTIVILVVRRLLKKDNSNYNFPINHYTVNVNGPNEPGKTQNATLATDVVFKEKGSSKIALPQQSEIRYVEIAEIIRCEADDNYTKFVLAGENILVSRSLKEYADQLKPKGFLRTHQSHLVNPVYVKSWLKEDGGMLQLNNNDKIPVSKPNREIVKEALGK
ncbi:LytTR family DNA-binding domain-containing protein [Pedobacter frigiditerrae]|uniref:LytR/AlgR family response regulator transcription factor n=1 Tax=Pedobacter frigiditerrae TaxID=2530452 RepID=UPI00292CC1D6|nr:LytTR family DNA-binding domain-containing protein [Pedobacter frigiditerrae]